MLRIAFVVLGLFAVAGFLLTGVLQTAAEARYPRVQWVVDAKPSGAVERATIEDLPTIAGTGPEGSTFVDRKYRSRSRPFAIEARVYLLARLGCLAALLTAIAGFVV
ncbi:hypothetical protein EON81_23380, partial [bacterium]